MNNKYAINAIYYADVVGFVTLPNGKTWEDVSEWFIKWDRIYIEFKDTTTWSCELNSETHEIIDWKRPREQSVYAVDKDGEPNFDEEVD